jgi:hypothetical protein
LNLPLIGPTYNGRSQNISTSRCVNFFLEMYPPGGKSKGALIGTPGLSLFQSVGTGIIRGAMFYNNLIYLVSGSGLYSISQAGTVSGVLMTLSTSSGRVWMSNNGLSPTGGNQIFITDSVNGYWYNVSDTTNAILSSWPAQIVSPRTCCYLGGYTIVSGVSGSFQTSALYDSKTWSALDVAAKVNSPDPLISVFNNHGELWLHGSYTTEIWAQTAGIHPPFIWIPGATLDYGSAAINSIAKGSNTIFWLANRRNQETGEFVGAVMAQGYDAVVISPPAIAWQWSQYTTVADAWGYCYSDEGHEFYVLTFPTANATWVYDVTTQLWHERSSYTNNPYATGRHLGNAYVYAWGNHYVGDYQSGNLYQMDSSFYSDNGTPIVSFRTVDHIFDEKNLSSRVIFKYQLDAETGVGDVTGLDPQATLAWSDDGGHTWSSEYQASMGKLGNYKTRLVWRRLGYSRDRVFRITMSDAVKKVLIDAYGEGVPSVTH